MEPGFELESSTNLISAHMESVQLGMRRELNNTQFEITAVL